MTFIVFGCKYFSMKQITSEISWKSVRIFRLELPIQHLVNAGQSHKAGAYFPGRFFVEDVGSRSPAFQSIYYVPIFRHWAMFGYKERRFKLAKGIKVSNSWGAW